VAEAFGSAQVQERGLLVRVDHPETGPLLQLASPVELGSTPARYDGLAPALGQDTDAVLEELGYGPERIAALKAEGVC
jgi:formyl-CoA transferase